MKYSEIIDNPLKNSENDRETVKYLFRVLSILYIL
jgi:hypothetical protein